MVPMGAPGQPERGPADKCRRTQTKEFRACSSQDEALARCDTRSGAVAGARDRTSDLVQPGAGGLRGDHDVIRRQRTLQLPCNARLLGSDWARLSRALDVASVVNPIDVDNLLAFVDPVDDPILPDPGATRR